MPDQEPQVIVIEHDPITVQVPPIVVGHDPLVVTHDPITVTVEHAPITLNHEPVTVAIAPITVQHDPIEITVDPVEVPGTTVVVGDPLLDIASGKVPGVTHINKFGRNPDIDAGSGQETVWHVGGTWQAPSEARPHGLSSTSTNDSATGVGARVVRIYGLTSWDAEEVSEDLVLQGTDDVPTANSYVMIHRMEVLSAGPLKTNDGAIIAIALFDGIETASIEEKAGQTQMAVYGIPSNKTAYLVNYYASIESPPTASANVFLYVTDRPGDADGVRKIKNTIGVSGQGGSSYKQEFKPYMKVKGPAVIELAIDVRQDNVDCSGGFNLILVDNE